jgi:hypothetical protein
VNSSSGISDRRRISARDLQHLAQRGAGRQRALARALDHRTVAMGSEKGTPSSIRSAPPRSSASTSAGVRSGDGIAGREIGDQALAPVALQVVEQAAMRVIAVSLDRVP